MSLLDHKFTLIGITPENWLSLSKDLTRLFHGAIGESQKITEYYEQVNSKRRTNISQSQRLFA